MMITKLIPLALAVVALNGCSEAQSADTRVNAQADTEAVAQLARAAASEDSASSMDVTGVHGPAQLGGIRDDVASYIQKTYALPHFLPHVLDMARALEQVFHVDLNDKSAVLAAARHYSLALDCIDKVAGGNTPAPHPDQIAHSVSAATFNTEERRRAEAAFQKAALGMAIPAAETICQTD